MAPPHVPDPHPVHQGRFVRAMSTALAYAKRYDDSNPDVGMGPSPTTLLRDVCAAGGVALTPKEQVEILADARQRFGLK